MRWCTHLSVPAVAIFVKTPELSPVKTRLARALGCDLAREFYIRSAAAVASVARCLGEGATAYWAVAESGALKHERWAALPVIGQGNGTLGQRLHQVYSTLQERHGCVMLLGADCPQIRAGALRQILAMLELSDDAVVIGPASDGGFWVFASHAGIAQQVWTSVDYSQAQTGANLVTALGGGRQIYRVDCLRDVDEIEDLPAVLTALDSLPDPTAEQVELARWLHTNIIG